VFVEKVGTPEGGLDRLPKEQRVLAANHYWEKQLEKLVTLEFTRDRKSMSVLVKHKAGNSLFVKGAPEGILERCSSIKVMNTASNTYEIQPLTAQAKQALQDSLKTLSNEALRYDFSLFIPNGHLIVRNRCIGLAVIDKAKEKNQYDFSTPDNFMAIEQNMTFVGIVAMLDPPRPEVCEGSTFLKFNLVIHLLY